MTTEQTAEKICAAIREAFGQSGQTVTANAKVNRGVCAGSVSYATKPESVADEFEVMCRVRKAYRKRGETIDLETPDGVELFFRIVLEAAKEIVSRNRAVNFVDRLRYEPRLYAGNAKDAWMCPVPCSAEFNRLPSKVELAQSPSFLSRKRREAKREPFRNPSKAARAGRVTTVTCPQCGTEIVIEDTAK